MSRSLWPRSPCPANPDSTHAPRRLHSHHAGHPAQTIMWESNPNSGSLPTESGFGETALIQYGEGVFDSKDLGLVFRFPTLTRGEGYVDFRLIAWSPDASFAATAETNSTNARLDLKTGKPLSSRSWHNPFRESVTVQ